VPGRMQFLNLGYLELTCGSTSSTALAFICLHVSLNLSHTERGTTRRSVFRELRSQTRNGNEAERLLELGGNGAFMVSPDASGTRTAHHRVRGVRGDLNARPAAAQAHGNVLRSRRRGQAAGCGRQAVEGAPPYRHALVPAAPCRPWVAAHAPCVRMSVGNRSSANPVAPAAPP